MNQQINNKITKINRINKANNGGVPVGTHSSSGVNQSSFYSSQTHSVHNGGPVGSANYEKVQAKYGMSKDFGSMRTNMNQ